MIPIFWCVAALIETAIGVMAFIHEDAYAGRQWFIMALCMLILANLVKES